MSTSTRSLPKVHVLASMVAAVFIPAFVTAQEARVLRVGTSGPLTVAEDKTDQAALETLESFIKEETGFDNEIQRQKDWRELAERLSKGEKQLGLFQGYEFAWAQEKDRAIKPLALAVNVHPYPTAYIVTRRDSASEFSALKGQSLAFSKSASRFLWLFLEHQCAQSGEKPGAFFSKTVTAENSEKAIDQVVDGAVSAALVDRAALEEYKRRKSVRFKNLKEVVQSRPFPPPIVAYYGNKLDDATVARLRKGLLSANQKEKGETLLGMFRLTGFIAPANDLEKVLEDIRKTYPASGQAAN